MILIQSCLRVSFTAKQSMHWLYITLEYFNRENDIEKYIKEMRDFIRKKYVKFFIEQDNYRTGFQTPHIVLNYLDYLIKQNHEEIVKQIPEAREIEFNNFTFKYRNSIEHFMSRHDKNISEKDEWIDDFGNLALLSLGTNVEIQNASPYVKVEHYNKNKNSLSEYSLKLQIMSKIVLSKDDSIPKEKRWNEQDSKNLTEKCIKVLKDDYALCEG